jgi:hypothetical protein
LSEKLDLRIRFRVERGSSCCSIGVYNAARWNAPSSRGAVAMEVGIGESQVGPGLQQVMHRLVSREGVIAGAEEGDEAVEGS